MYLLPAMPKSHEANPIHAHLLLFLSHPQTKRKEEADCLVNGNNDAERTGKINRPLCPLTQVGKESYGGRRAKKGAQRIKDDHHSQACFGS